MVNDKDGFVLRENTGEGRTFNNAYLAKTFLDCMNETDALSASCKLATVPADTNGEAPEGTKLYAILTDSLEAKYAENAEPEESENELEQETEN